jgi:glycosyltransferase involved in cell wall biosynthesis
MVTRRRGIDVIPNGVDATHYLPVEGPGIDRSCVFWGRLDFGPNIDALRWFCRSVWPLLRQRHVAARFDVFGFHPTDEVMALDGRDGVRVIPDLPDLREEVSRRQVVVLPFISGGGIKNKLLEAAAMGKAIVGSRKVFNGLTLGRHEPVLCAQSPSQWVTAIETLWEDDQRRRELGRRARLWVCEEHSWDTAARRALAGLATG